MKLTKPDPQESKIYDINITFMELNTNENASPG